MRFAMISATFIVALLGCEQKPGPGYAADQPGYKPPSSEVKVDPKNPQGIRVGDTVTLGDGKFACDYPSTLAEVMDRYDKGEYEAAYTIAGRFDNCFVGDGSTEWSVTSVRDGYVELGVAAGAVINDAKKMRPFLDRLLLAPMNWVVKR